MLSHSFDRFYAVTKIEILKVLDLNLTVSNLITIVVMWLILKRARIFKISSTIKEMFVVYCKNIIPYMYLYKHQVEYYEKTVYDILEKDIGLILPQFEDREKNVNLRCQKRQIISALISGFIG